MKMNKSILGVMFLLMVCGVFAKALPHEILDPNEPIPTPVVAPDWVPSHSGSRNVASCDFDDEDVRCRMWTWKRDKSMTVNEVEYPILYRKGWIIDRFYVGNKMRFMLDNKGTVEIDDRTFEVERKRGELVVKESIVGE
jgi:hypothetical protein